MPSNRTQQLYAVMTQFLQFFSEYWAARERASANGCDFAFGNPHDMPLPGIEAALQKHAVAQNKDWFAYKMSEAASQRHVADALRDRLGIPFEPEDVAMTNGAFGALQVALAALLDEGDEVIINLPPWFFYEALIAASRGVTVKVKVKPQDFDLDLDAIRVAITPKTRAVIVNSPNNPTGKIYTADTLRALAGILTDASQQHGQPIYLISDEAYSRILFGGNSFLSPTAFYPYSFLVYTYGKTLLMPGQRLGYLVLSPAMPDREQMRQALLIAQVTSGWGFPNAVMQYALPELDKLTLDLELLQHKRDWMVSELTAMGYQLGTPEGTFYLLVRSPLADDIAFTRQLAEQNIFCLPGSVAEIPGYFRISLTANEAMIGRALPGFEKAIRQVQAKV